MLCRKFIINLFIAMPMACAHWTAYADEAIVKFNIGKIQIYQQGEEKFLSFRLGNGLIMRARDQLGRRFPPVFTDALGMIYIGDKVINAVTGNLIVDGNNYNAIRIEAHYRLV